MTRNISVCIGTYGDRQTWSQLVHERAMPSVDRQTRPAANLSWAHRHNLAEARNDAAAGITDGWLCFLDADDELDPNYLEAMERAAEAYCRQGDWLLQPATLGVYPDGREDVDPVVIPRKPLIDGNFMVIGTLIRAQQFHRLGGFRDFDCYEDWDLWLRAWIDGADLLPVPSAIYRVHVNSGSRNDCARDQQVRVYNQIRSLHLPAALMRAR